MITQEELKARFVYDSKTGIFTWQPGYRAKAGAIVQPNSFDKDGYRLIGITVKGERKTFRAHKLAWLYMTGEYPNFYLDHIDRNVKNNSWNNLRKFTNQLNQRNSGNWRTNKSGVKGVCWCKNSNLYRYRVAIRTGIGNQKFLGNFSDFDEAVCTRLAAEQCLDWDKSDPNSPAYQHVQKM